jgi:hypothetical protein
MGRGDVAPIMPQQRIQRLQIRPAGHEQDPGQSDGKGPGRTTTE